MKRRRGRGLGSSANEHQGRGEGFMADATRAARDAMDHITNGRCGAASHEMTRANRIYGSALAEYKGAGWKRSIPQTASRAITLAQDRFNRYCLR